MQRTYETRLPADPARDVALSAYADLYGRAERTLFARLRAGESLVRLKRAFLVRFGLTARQFNSFAATLQGKIASIQRSRPRRIGSLERRIAQAEKVLAKTPPGMEAHHQKRRRLAILEHRLRTLRADQETGRIRLCFGSRKLFRAQFALPSKRLPLA